MYVVPLGVRSGFALRSFERFGVIAIILLISPFIAFFGSRADIEEQLEEAVGLPRSIVVPKLRAWIAPLE